MKKLFFLVAVCLAGVCFTSCDSGCTCELTYGGEVYSTQELDTDEECDAVDGISSGGAKWTCN